MAVCQLILLAIVVIGAEGDNVAMNVLSQASSESTSTSILGEERAFDLDTLYGTYGTQRHDEPLRPRSFGGTKRVTQFIVAGPGKRLGGDEKPLIAASTPVGSQAAASLSDSTSATQTEPSAVIGQACSSNTSCLVANSECVEGECRCLTNHITFGSASCLRRANFLGDTCYMTQQCTHLHNVAICYQGRCLCEPIYYVAGRSCTSTFDYDAFGQGGVDSTSSGPAPSCSRKAKVGRPCCDNNQCRYNVWNSHCRAGTCQCDSGYVNIGDQMCVRFASALGDACSVDAQCAQIANSECNQNGTCSCRSLFTPRIVATARRLNKRQTSTNVCLPFRNLGDSCEISAQCDRFTPNVVCTNSICASSFVAPSPQVNSLVAPSPQEQINALLTEIATLGGNETCIASKQCITENAICDPVSDQCQCNAATHCQVGNACEAYAAIGVACKGDCQCNSAEATCNGTPAVCSCASTLRHDAVTNTCVDFVLAFQDPVHLGGPFCCSPPGQNQPMLVGQAAASLDSTATVIAITTTNVNFASDANGAIMLAAGTDLTTTTTVTFTATATGGTATLTDVFDVIITPDPCCTMAPTNPVTAASVIGNGITALNSGQCENTATGHTLVDLAGNSIMQGQINAAASAPQVATATEFFSSLGCDDTLTLSDVTITNMAGITCTVTGTNMVNAVYAASLVVQPGLTCTIAGTVGSCNGMESTFNIALNYFCSNA